MILASRAGEVVHLIERLGHRAALVGGLAVSLRTRPRFTKDIDLAVAVHGDKATEALAFALQRSGLLLEEVLEQEERRVLATLRFRHRTDPGDDPTIDLLCASSGIEPEIVKGATRLPLSRNVTIPVARVPHLIAMKVLAERPARPNDRADLQALIAVASEADLREARSSLALIVERGFHRGRDLLAAFEALLLDRSTGR